MELIEYPRKVMLKLAIWPHVRTTAVYKSRTALTMLIVVTFTLCLSYNASLQLGDFVALSESLYMLISVANTSLKLTMVLWNREDALTVLEMVDGEPCFLRYWNKYRESVVDDFKNMVKTVVNVYWVNVNATVFFMIIFPAVESQPLPFAFPHFNNGTFHYPFYLFESVSLIVAAYGNMAVDLLTAGTIGIAALQLKILNAKLRDTDRNVGHRDPQTIDRATVEYLAECCHHYVVIERYVKRLTKVLSVIIFVQMGSSIVAICNAGMMVMTVELVSVEAVSLFFYLVTMTSQLGMYCWFGNIVYLESLEVMTTCYMSNWSERGPAVRKTLFILMERSKRPLQITGTKFVTLTFGAFVSILKWSYSYFALLKNYMDKTG